MVIYLCEARLNPYKIVRSELNFADYVCIRQLFVSKCNLLCYLLFCVCILFHVFNSGLSGKIANTMQYQIYLCTIIILVEYTNANWLNVVTL